MNETLRVRAGTALETAGKGILIAEGQIAVVMATITVLLENQTMVLPFLGAWGVSTGVGLASETLGRVIKPRTEKRSNLIPFPRS